MSQGSSSHRILFDISDLVTILSYSKNPTGIQRVQEDTLRKLMHDGANVVPVIFSNSVKSYVRADFARLATRDQKYLHRMRLTKPTFARRLRDRLALRGSRITMQASDTVFVSGSATYAPKRNKYLAGDASKDVTVSWMCYDLIPLRHPEYTGDPVGSHNLFKSWLDAALARGDRFICISEFVRNDLIAYAAEQGHEVSATAVPLAHEFNGASGFHSSQAAQLANERFVLFVSSVNVRKNQFGLVKLWSKLYSEFKEKLPALVLVGQPWEAERLFRFLDGTGYLEGKVVHLANASDHDLAFLYENCDFTIFPSLYEGWGLPVGESLWMGKPCLSSNRTSLPEAGGPHVTYFDPLADGDMERAVRNALSGKFDAMPPSRESLRTWQDVARDIARTLAG
jgi:glycosyltransferase involved in cell wall biosynthesis